MEKHKLMTTKEFIKVGIFFVVFFTLGSTESCSYEKEETNHVTTVVVDTTVTEEDYLDKDLLYKHENNISIGH
tara:strand:+ start:343 stop:561 length:219 start_codon:yes stop_codon:yes gene_type:complete